MVRRARILAAFIAVVSFVVFTACGGGGNMGGVGGVEPVILPPQQTNASLETTDRPIVQAVGDLKFTIPARTSTAPVRVTISRSTPVELPQFRGFTPADQAGCQIRVSAELNGPITIEPVVPVANRAGKVVWFYLSKATGSWRIINDTSTALSIKVKETAFASTNVVDGIVGHFLLTPIETTSSLKLLKTNPAGNEFSALVIVHGFNAQAADFQLAADRISVWPMEDRYRKIYALEYDYRQHPFESAVELAAQIDNLPFANIDVLGHSAGVVAIRDMLKHHRNSRHVNTAYLVNGANLGSVWAGVGGALNWLNEDVLNNHPLSAGSLLATLETPVVADLTPGSNYLNELNTPQGRPATTALLLIGATRDTVVTVGTENGGRADSVPFEAMTACVVRRTTLVGDHSTLIATNSGLDKLLAWLFAGHGAPANVTTRPDGGNLEAGDWGWDYDIIVNNHGDQNLTLDSVDIESYDYWGNWMSQRSVIGSDGQLSNGYAKCDLTVRPGDPLWIHIHEWVDDSHGLVHTAPLILLGRTHHIRARYRYGGNDDQIGWPPLAIRMCYGDVQPTSPIWWSRLIR